MSRLISSLLLAAAALLAQLADTGSFSFSPSGKAITAEITPEDLRAKLG